MNLTQLAERLFPGTVVVGSEELSGGLAAKTTAVFLKNPPTQLIIRQPHAAKWGNPEVAADQFRMLQLVHSLGLPAPEPLWLDTTGDLLGSPGIVMRRIDGKPDYDPANRVGAARQIATLLARLHEAAVSPSDLSFVPRGHPSLSLLAELPSHTGDPSWGEASVRSAVLKAWPFSRRNRDVLLHGDFWPGNLLWRDGALVGIVDWEDAARDSPLLDFAIARLDTLMIYGGDAFEAFDTQYRALVSHDFTNLPLWDLVATLRLGRLVTPMAQGWPALGRPDITERFIRETLRKFAASALENCEL